MEDIHSIFGSWKSVYSLAWREVCELLNNELSSFVFPSFSKSEAASDNYVISDKVKEWCSPIIDLSGYPYATPVAGVNGAIHNWLLTEKRTIQIFRGDYQWIKMIDPVVKVRIIEGVDELDTKQVLYISNPFAGDGNYIENWFDILNTDVRIVLDCAYLGTVPVERIKLSSNVEKVFMSLSKGFGLNSLRVGYSFSRDRDIIYDSLVPISYYPKYIPYVFEKIINDFPVDFWSKKMAPFQEEVCKKFELEASDSFLLAVARDKKFSYWQRAGLFRVPLAYYYMNNTAVRESMVVL